MCHLKLLYYYYNLLPYSCPNQYFYNNGLNEKMEEQGHPFQTKRGLCSPLGLAHIYSALCSKFNRKRTAAVLCSMQRNCLGAVQAIGHIGFQSESGAIAVIGLKGPYLRRQSSRALSAANVWRAEMAGTVLTKQLWTDEWNKSLTLSFSRSKSSYIQ